MEGSGLRVRLLALLAAVGSALLAGGWLTIPSPEGHRIAVSYGGDKAKWRSPAPAPGNDPPLDSISHQVQFIVGLSGGISPNFTLAKFRGPAQSGSLASASRVRTHTLAIIMASPRGGRTNTNDFATEA